MTEERKQQKIEAMERLIVTIPKLSNLGQEILQMIEGEERRERRWEWVVLAIIVALIGALTWMVIAVEGWI